MSGIQKSISIKNHYPLKFINLKDPIKEWRHKINTKNTEIPY